MPSVHPPKPLQKSAVSFDLVYFINFEVFHTGWSRKFGSPFGISFSYHPARGVKLGFVWWTYQTCALIFTHTVKPTINYA